MTNTTDTAESASTDRRHHDRRAVRIDATLTRIGGRSLVDHVRTFDLSEGGAGIVASKPFNVGDVVVLGIVAGSLSIDYQGLVVGRRAGDAGTQVLNVAFKTVDPQSVVDLRRIIELHAGPDTS